MKTIFPLLLLFLCAGPLTAAEREVRLEREFGTLHGTLRIPEGGSRVVALLIAGSGPTDRNCNSRQGLYTNSFVYLADALEKQGIASLRYDKRGIGASRYDDPEKIFEVSFDDYIGDAAAWTEWLRDQGFEKIVLVGHSEGALIALCVAADAGDGGFGTASERAARTIGSAGDRNGIVSGTESSDRKRKDAAVCGTEETAEVGGKEHEPSAREAFAESAGTERPHSSGEAKQGRRPDAVVSLEGAGFPLDDVLRMQLAARLATADMGLLMQVNRILGALRQGRTVEDYPRELENLFTPYLQRYWISELKYDPQAVIRRIRVPVLIVNGDNDLQVSVANAEALHRAKPDAALLVIPGMTHPLKQSEGRSIAEQTAVYMDASLPLDPTLAQAVPQFILGL